MRNSEQPHGLTLLERADTWVRWLRDPERSYNPNVYSLLADLLVDMQQENHRIAISSNELGEFIACFDAAFAEGLNESLTETTDDRLKDLVERRLLAGYFQAIGPSLQKDPT